MRMLPLGMALVVGACSVHHVHLQVPDRVAPLDERLDAYDRLAPGGFQETHYVDHGRAFKPRAQFVDYLELRDGTRIFLPEDILPAVEQDSEAAAAVEESLRRRRTWKRLRRSGPLLVVSGLGMVIAGLVSNQSGPRKALLAGGSVAFSIGIGMQIGRRYVRQNEEHWERAAYMAYGAGLRERLDVCHDADADPRCRAPVATTKWESGETTSPR